MSVAGERASIETRAGLARWGVRLLPFLRWFEGYSYPRLRADLVSGITVALVIVPQSMAYAQLAGLPPYYGLYAALLPPLIASLFGSSNQLATGPVAVVSLMTSSALAPLATAGSVAYIEYAILLALIVGVFQLLLGVLRLGLIVNLLSHPVINGFTNAAAIVIATSQLSKLLGVNVDSEEHHIQTVVKVIRTSIHHVHWPTLALAVLALALMAGLKWINPRIPYVLVAVVATTFLAWLTNFENTANISLAQIQDPAVVQPLREYNRSVAEIDVLMDQRISLSDSLRAGEFSESEDDEIQANAELAKLQVSIELERQRSSYLRDQLRDQRIVGIEGGGEDAVFYPVEDAGQQRPDGTLVWRLRVGNQELDENSIVVLAGGEVIGNIPRGLPALQFPRLSPSAILELLPMAIVIALLGFMEAISIAKRIAQATGQKLDPNQELIGQGLANISGSLFRSYAVSGSFSRSAVNFQAGAVTGLSVVFSSLAVLVTLLFLTPLLFYIPLSVLAAVIIMAVFQLINVRGFIHAWNAQKYDGVVSVITFALTLGLAPHLEYGILAGVFLSTLLFLYRTMRPNWWLLSRSPDGEYRRIDVWNLEACKHVAVLAFNRSIMFANVDHFTAAVEEVMRNMPGLRHVLVVGYAINELDASGEVGLSVMVTRLRQAGMDISFCGLNEHVHAVMHRTGLYEKIGEDHMYTSMRQAIEDIHQGRCLQSATACPLVNPDGMERTLQDVLASPPSASEGDPNRDRILTE
jgi:SulP family sulfate permease